MKFPSRVLHVLMGTAGMPPGTDDLPHGYCVSSQVLKVVLQGVTYLFPENGMAVFHTANTSKKKATQI